MRERRTRVRDTDRGAAGGVIAQVLERLPVLRATDRGVGLVHPDAGDGDPPLRLAEPLLPAGGRLERRDGGTGQACGWDAEERAP